MMLHPTVDSCVNMCQSSPIRSGEMCYSSWLKHHINPQQSLVL